MESLNEIYSQDGFKILMYVLTGLAIILIALSVIAKRIVRKNTDTNSYNEEDMESLFSENARQATNSDEEDFSEFDNMMENKVKGLGDE